jgi:hypothetical protein
MYNFVKIYSRSNIMQAQLCAEGPIMSLDLIILIMLYRKVDGWPFSLAFVANYDQES